MKIVKPRTGGSIDPAGADWTSTYYVYDAEGVVLATYSQTYDAIEEKDYLHLSQNYSYGLQRLGHLERDPLVAQTGSLGEPGDAGVRKLGAKAYELSNHLGNVLATVSDRKFGVEGAPTLVEYYEADILSYSDYYPFGMQMPGRNASTGDYRYGFQGQETDDEITGSESHVSYKYRMHDARLGRFLSIDPLAPKYPHNSPYAFSENRVIDRIELEGLESALTQGTDVRANLARGWKTVSEKLGIGEMTIDDYKSLNSSWIHVRDRIALAMAGSSPFLMLEAPRGGKYAYLDKVFHSQSRDLTAYTMARYMGGKGGVDIFDYNRLEAQNIWTFSKVNNSVGGDISSAATLWAAETKQSQGPGVCQKSIATKGFHKQTGDALMHDFGSAIGSFDVDGSATLTTQIDAAGNTYTFGTISYILRDTYDYNPQKQQGSGMKFVEDGAHHQSWVDMKQLGAANYYIRAYYQQSITIYNGDVTLGPISNSSASGASLIPEGEVLINDYRE